MSDYNARRSGETQQEENDDSLDETQSVENTSIIGKVKSRVSSIIPSSISKWFSPSHQRSDSINGSLNESSGLAKRRRRLELEEEEEDEIEDGDMEEEEDIHNKQRNKEEENSDDDDDDESNNADVDGAPAITPSVNVRRSSNIYSGHPPSKRSRLNVENTNMLDTPFLSHSPLVASTPAIGNNFRSSISYSPTLNPARPSRYTHLNYGNQSEREPAYNFQTSASKVNRYELQSNTNPNISNTVPLKTGDTNAQNCAFNNFGLSSRRNLNIPTTSNYSGGLTKLSRQSLATVKNELPSTSAGIQEQRPVRTSTTIFEIDNGNTNDELEEENASAEEGESYPQSGTDSGKKKYNGRDMASFMLLKRQKLTNGIDGSDEVAGANVVSNDDSVSESSDVDRTERAQSVNRRDSAQRKTGLFNLSGSNSRNGSRTSSFGNGLNFFTHLEGRKSLFAGAQGTTEKSQLNNSTLSLTSLNRRQFNASIYGSTSALSDSRLLNTFSPFYKGRTTYGGAAAYNKCSLHPGAGNGAGANAVRITPTLIRPTSSLSTLSSSNNSLAAAGAHATGEPSSAISSTAKRILDLINDFSTPLSEAKKMANSLKSNQQSHLPQAKPRLSDADLHASRAMRLSQVRTPYVRPSVTLQPTNANEKSGLLPPIRELQVPSMSQLLQMKKLQSTTERSRQIATQNSHNTTQVGISPEYTLPIEEVDTSDGKHKPQAQQKRTNKIRNKINTARPSKELVSDDTPPPPVNLPNIAFPLMKSIPKIDIALPTPTSTSAVRTTTALTKTETNATFAFTSNNTSINVKNIKTTTNVTSPSASVKLSAMSSPAKDGGDDKDNFKFSAPLELQGINSPTRNVMAFNGNFKFSPPAMVQASTLSSSTVFVPKFETQPTAAPTLKTGSVLDALKTPFMMPSSTIAPVMSKMTTSAPSVASSAPSAAAFGSQFKMSSSEWECSTCLIRNKQEAIKCVACETPRKTATPTPANTKTTTATVTSIVAVEPKISPPASGFGSQFKMSSSEWECSTCMIRNKQELNKCVACETPRKGATVTTASTATTLDQPIKNNFGDAFKPKANNWECPTCLISNKSESNACVACETKKPGAAASPATAIQTTSAAPLSTFKFGFPPAFKNDNADATFKSLAAEQKAAKWECEACMTRNDISRLKCVCCDQAKPGTQLTSENAPKFSFGMSTASKFNFGFGPNAPREDELRKSEVPANKVGIDLPTLTQKTETKGFLFEVKPTEKPFGSLSSGSFSFGSKPATTVNTEAPTATEAAASEPGKDGVNTKTSAAVPPPPSYQFGVANSSIVAATTASTSTGSSFVFGFPAATTKPAETSATTTKSSSPSVKFSLASTTTNKETLSNATSNNPMPAPAYSFGFSANTNTTNKPTSSFVLGTPSTANTTSDVAKTITGDTSSTNTFSFKAPTAITTAATSSTSTFSFRTPPAVSASATSGAAVKPLFTFNTPPSTTVTTSVTTSGETSTTNAITVTSTSSAFKPIFGSTLSPAAASTSSTTTTTTTLPPSTTAPTSSTANVFGSFGTSAAGNAATPTFGVPFKASSLGAATSSSTLTFGSFGAAASSASTNKNIFGSFGAQSSESKPTAAATTLFGNAKSTAAASSSASPAAAFVFGSSSPAAHKPNSSTETVTSSTSNTAWPKEGMVFGASSTGTATSAISSTTSDTSKSVFGSFGATQQSGANNASSTSATPIFGNLAASNSTPNTGFGATNTFGSNTATVNPTNSLGGPVNIFGAVQSGNAATPAPAFGASAFSNTTSMNATPAFGSAPAAPATFGSFGSIAAASTNDGASAPKKSEPIFNFGAAAASTQNTSGAFNFGNAANTPKPAFNFAPTNQPAFNFTGSSEQTQTTRPFQFGAAPAAPVFNFSGGAQEATPSAPFQFGAGAMPAANNIFAPTPTPGAQSAQQARRKIRTPIRRLTPR